MGYVDNNLEDGGYIIYRAQVHKAGLVIPVIFALIAVAFRFILINDTTPQGMHKKRFLRLVSCVILTGITVSLLGCSAPAIPTIAPTFSQIAEQYVDENYDAILVDVMERAFRDSGLYQRRLEAIEDALATQAQPYECLVGPDWVQDGAICQLSFEATTPLPVRIIVPVVVKPLSGDIGHSFTVQHDQMIMNEDPIQVWDAFRSDTKSMTEAAQQASDARFGQ